MDPFLGEIKLVPYNFAPTGWAMCAGQILSIAQNTALFSLLGTTYGGNGQTTFALPDLRDRIAVSRGQGPGLSDYDQGAFGGAGVVTLTPSQLPPHTHGVLVSSALGTSPNPSGKHLAGAPLGMGYVYGPTPADTMPSDTVVPTGGNAPHSNRQPVLALNYIIALQGVFPPRQ
jgi:microcystin-dependent protein